jgi:transcriptional regulator with XRE-family HTH domain
MAQKLGEIIKRYRETHDNMSLREFAKRCGLSHAYIDKLENGYDPVTGKPVSPTLTTVTAIANALGITNEELMEEIGYVKDVDNTDAQDPLEKARGVLRRSGKKMTLEDKRRILRIIEAAIPADDDEE